MFGQGGGGGGGAKSWPQNRATVVGHRVPESRLCRGARWLPYDEIHAVRGSADKEWQIISGWIRNLPPAGEGSRRGPKVVGLRRIPSGVGGVFEFS
jgi:hypothetical protein